MFSFLIGTALAVVPFWSLIGVSVYGRERYERRHPEQR